MYQLEPFMAELERKNPAQPEFIQAVREVVESVIDMVNDNPVYEQNKILERITEPDRVVMFRVDWEDDQGHIQTNRGYRVQFNNAIGPYKGGLRFHSSVTLGSLKFLGFEQTFKNSLTTLPMGGGKGGSDFNPRGKSDAEIQRFCRSFMTELQKYIGPDTDVPAGDIGVGGREIGFLYGQYKRIRGENTGVLTGKGLGYGGSLIRPEATGFGTMYFANELLKEHHDSFKDKRVSLSGFGNVAWGAAMKASQLGAKVVTISGPDGYVIDENGVGTEEKWAFMQQLRASNKDVVEPYAKKFGARFVPGRKP
ncbi:MAG: Glu/Leu/Phe/Val dehydrogenase dimerization domain-containing protein, partial [Sphaerochaetaceae bacterium]